MELVTRKRIKNMDDKQMSELLRLLVDEIYEKRVITLKTFEKAVEYITLEV